MGSRPASTPTASTHKPLTPFSHLPPFLLKALSARIDLDSEQTAAVLDGCGFCFLFAQMFHPAMKHVAGVRKQIGVPSVFNVLGPLTNPAQPANQVIGVSRKALAPLFARIFQLQRRRHSLVVHSHDGLDEISIAGPTDVYEVREGQSEIKTWTVVPEDFSVARHPLQSVSGGSLAERVAAFWALLDGKPGPHRDFVVVNAAAGVYVSGLAPSLAAAAQLVKDALDSGKAKRFVEQYIALTRAIAPAPPMSPAAVVGASGAGWGAGVGDVTVSRYVTAGGIRVQRREVVVQAAAHIEQLVDLLDSHRGALFASSYEYPGRYTRWDIGFADPPLLFTGTQRSFVLEPLNARGAVLMPAIYQALRDNKNTTTTTTTTSTSTTSSNALLETLEMTETQMRGTVRVSAERFPEEERSRQPSLFSVIRALIDLFSSPADSTLGLFGSFAYDLAFQFEHIRQARPRPADHRDVVLYIPDCIVKVELNRIALCR